MVIKIMNMLCMKKKLSEYMALTGFLSVLEKCKLKNKAFVLMYHRILDRNSPEIRTIQPGMFVSSDTFIKQIDFLRSRYKIVFLEEIVTRIIDGKDIDGLCAITFDDGWLDNFTNAFPILKACSVPATIFLATDHVGTGRNLWPEELCRYLGQGILGKPSFDDAPPSYVRFIEELRRLRPCSQEIFLDNSVEILKAYSPYDREEIMGYFRGMDRTDPMSRQIMNWDEVREMYSSGLVRFGAHTASHEILDRVPLQRAQYEISRSRIDIVRNLGSKVSIFAYPNGNYTKSVLNLLVESGFNAAVTTRKGLLQRGVQLMEIPRIAIHEDVTNTIPMFRSRILFP